MQADVQGVQGVVVLVCTRRLAWQMSSVVLISTSVIIAPATALALNAASKRVGTISKRPLIQTLGTSRPKHNPANTSGETSPNKNPLRAICACHGVPKGTGCDSVAHLWSKYSVLAQGGAT